MSIKVISSNVHSNTVALLNSSSSKGNSIGWTIEQSKDAVSKTLSKLKSKPDSLLGSNALRQLKLLASDDYVIDAKSNTAQHHNFNAQTAYKQLIEDIEASSDADKTKLADAAIMLLKQGKSDKFTQEQLMGLSVHASPLGKVDLYASLLTDRNQSNKNIVDALLPANLATALREELELVNNPEDGMQAMHALELASISSRAYQAANPDDRAILQLLTTKSVEAVKLQGYPVVTSIAHSIVSGDLAQDAVLASLKDRNAYSSLQTLKTLLSKAKKLDSFIDRDIGSLTSVVATSPDSAYLLKNLAQSGVLNSEAVQKVYSNILRHNDVRRDKSLSESFLKNLETSQPLTTSDYLKLYKKTLTHARNQPISDTLDVIYKLAQDSELSNRPDEPESSDKQHTTDIREIVSLHSMVLSKCDQVSQMDDVTLAQVKPIDIIVNSHGGRATELDLSQLSSPAELNLILNELAAKEVVISEPKDGMDDYISTDIRLAVEDYINNEDDRLSIYLSKPISEAAPLIAGKLQTDVFQVASLIDARLITNKTPKIALKDSLAEIDARINFIEDSPNGFSYGTNIKNIKTNYDLIEHARLYQERLSEKNNQPKQSVSIKVKVESSRLDNEFLKEINKKLTDSVIDSLSQTDKNGKAIHAINKDVDDILCLPVTVISDKIKTNTIFNDAAIEPQKINNNQTKLSR